MYTPPAPPWDADAEYLSEDNFRVVYTDGSAKGAYARTHVFGGEQEYMRTRQFPHLSQIRRPRAGSRGAQHALAAAAGHLGRRPAGRELSLLPFLELDPITAFYAIAARCFDRVLAGADSGERFSVASSGSV